jgi:hypothetical protein
LFNYHIYWDIISCPKFDMFHMGQSILTRPYGHIAVEYKLRTLTTKSSNENTVYIWYIALIGRCVSRSAKTVFKSCMTTNTALVHLLNMYQLFNESHIMRQFIWWLDTCTVISRVHICFCKVLHFTFIRVEIDYFNEKIQIYFTCACLPLDPPFCDLKKYSIIYMPH